MKLIFTVRLVTKANADQCLVQATGKYGDVNLNLPLDQNLAVGDEFHLEGRKVKALAIIDEWKERGHAIPFGIPDDSW
jgi:hypothetical protein